VRTVLGALGQGAGFHTRTPKERQHVNGALIADVQCPATSVGCYLWPIHLPSLLRILEGSHKKSF
jgi:hypothetical protein